jgi:hypothetical protein
MYYSFSYGVFCNVFVLPSLSSKGLQALHDFSVQKKKNGKTLRRTGGGGVQFIEAARSFFSY